MLSILYILPTFSAAPAAINFPLCYDKGLHFCRGDTIKVRIPITGTPTPHVEWFKGRKAVEDIKALSSRLEIAGSNLHSTLIIDDCVKSDEGVYLLAVHNELGTASVEVPVSVIGEFVFVR